MTPGTGIAPAPHWREASAFTTAPPLRPTPAVNDNSKIVFRVIYLFFFFNNAILELNLGNDHVVELKEKMEKHKSCIKLVIKLHERAS